MKIETRYISDDIFNMFNSSDLNFEFKNEILGRIRGITQAMYNAVHAPEKMTMVDTHGDAFQEAHNEVVTLYQKHTKLQPN
jgi:hypothetical protein